MLRTLNEYDHDGRAHVIKQLGVFSFENHTCLVHEQLGPSLYDFLQANSYKPYPMYCVRDFARQLLESLELLARLQLTHTDLKARPNGRLRWALH